MRQLIFTCIFLVLITSCTKDKVIIHDTGSKIIINGLITSADLLGVRISKSIYITDQIDVLKSSLVGIDNAQVIISQNKNAIDSLCFNVLGTSSFIEEYLYQKSNYVSRCVYPKPGQEYEVLVKASGSEEASSITTIPNVVNIERIDTSRITLNNLPCKCSIGLKCNIEFTDPANESNYYLLNTNIGYNADSSIVSDWMDFLCDDPIVEEKLRSHFGKNLYSNNINGVAFSDKLINGKKTILTITINGKDIGLPFCNFSIIGNEDNTHKKIISFRLYSITEDYFKFIQTLNLYDKSYDNPLSDPVSVYSNVKGGYGIFAGASVSVDSIVFNY